MVQIGPAEGYELSVGSFRADLSTLGDSMVYHHGMRFSAK